MTQFGTLFDSSRNIASQFQKAQEYNPPKTKHTARAIYEADLRAWQAKARGRKSSRVRAHVKRTKTGKVAQVKEHKRIVVGKTASGKDIHHQTHQQDEGFSTRDHLEAHLAHREAGNQEQSQHHKKKFEDKRKSEYVKHYAQARRHKKAGRTEDHAEHMKEAQKVMSEYSKHRGEFLEKMGKGKSTAKKRGLKKTKDFKVGDTITMSREPYYERKGGGYKEIKKKVVESPAVGKLTGKLYKNRIRLDDGKLYEYVPKADMLIGTDVRYRLIRVEAGKEKESLEEKPPTAKQLKKEGLVKERKKQMESVRKELGLSSDYSEGDKIVFTKGRHKGLTGTVTWVLGNSVEAIFPGLAKKGINTRHTTDAKNIEKQKEEKK